MRRGGTRLAAGLVAAVLLTQGASTVVRRLSPAPGLSPRLGRFDLAPDGDLPDVVTTRDEARRLCGRVGLRAAARPARLIETFPFQRESALLAVKLRELQGVVDVFVPVESEWTFAGRPSSAWLRDGLLDGVGRWLHRSVHPLTVTDRPDCDDIVNTTRGLQVPSSVSGDAAAERGWRCGWAQEFARRRVGLEYAVGRLGLGDDDVLVVTDADEVMSRESAAVLKHCRWGSTEESHADGVSLTPLMSMHYYGLDYHGNDGWTFARAVRAGDVRRHGAAAYSSIRYVGLPEGVNGKPMHFVRGGWHMSFFSSLSVAQRKLRDSPHQELVGEGTLSAGRIDACMRAGIDAWGRPDSARFEPANTASKMQSLVTPELYLQYHGPQRVPALMQEYREAFGERRPWLPGSLRGEMSEEERSRLEARCLDVGGGGAE